jgi:hypothetical protein
VKCAWGCEDDSAHPASIVLTSATAYLLKSISFNRHNAPGHQIQQPGVNGNVVDVSRLDFR